MNKDLKHDLYESPVYAYLKLKANGDKDADGILEQLARLQSDGVNLSCLASLVPRQPAPEDTTDLPPVL